MIICSVNRRRWWHVRPRNPDAHQKRGMFLASSFKEAEFWGRPLDRPKRVSVINPLVGDEESIEKTLFGQSVSNEGMSVEMRWKLDAKMRKRALACGYDSILLMTPKSFSAQKEIGKIPRSLELNVFDRSRVTDS